MQKNVPLAHWSSFKIGGPARYFFAAKTADQIREVLREARKRKLEVFILGGGTNLLFPDAGWKGLVLRVNIGGIRARGSEVTMGAGVSVSDLLMFTAKKGLSGLEWAGGLPGTVGGAVRGNAGAFGGETKDAIRAVRSLNAKTLREREWSREECSFAYRTSVFSARGGSAFGGKKRNGEEIILSATFALRPGSARAIQKAIQEKIHYRTERHPLEYPNIGSIFKNVPVASFPAACRSSVARVIKNDPFPVVPTAYLLAEAGLKGVSCGGAMFSPRHPNFIVNVLGATASDVKALIALAQTKVKQRYGVTLEPEVIEA